MTRFTSPIGILIASALVLTGCSGPGETAGERPDRPAPGGAGWESEIADAVRHATTDFERNALADGRISDAEFAEMENGFVECLRDRNVTFGGFGPAGGYGFTPGPGTTTAEANGIADECSASSGLDTVGSLYFAMQRNPQNLDEASITAACLVKKKVVPQTYSASDYARDTPTRAYPFTDAARGEKAMEECDTDPLGLLEGQKR
ncbi:hypothetical protein [Leifsonia sp. P73]|uniref:hypothetical protein n=1 Tax=Leifsonia sp. P73 TaxID=3423959 RepID=UPI003DA57F50